MTTRDEPMVERVPLDELIEALDNYSKLDDVQRELIKRWAEGEDVNDMRRLK